MLQFIIGFTVGFVAIYTIGSICALQLRNDQLEAELKALRLTRPQTKT